MSWAVPARPPDPELLERIYQRVQFDEATGCRVWTGSRNSDGHGTVKYAGGTSYAHRLAWRAVLGKLPPRRLVLRHVCKHPACVRVGHPAHVRQGTQSHNIRDQYQALSRLHVSRQPRSAGERFVRAARTGNSRAQGLFPFTIVHPDLRTA